MSCPRLLFVPRQAILLPVRFRTPRPRAPSLLRGRRPAPSPHLASLSGRGDARAKGISLHAGTFHRAAETSSGNSSSIPKPYSDVPRNAVLSQGRCPGKEAFSVVDFSHRETGLKQAAAARRTFLNECCTFTEALAWSEPHFAAASSARLWAFALSPQGRRASGELVPPGPCFPGLQVHILGSSRHAKISRHSLDPAAACVA